MSENWYVKFLDGTAANASGTIDLDTEGGVVTFRDESGELDSFFNLGAIVYGARDDDDSKDE